MSNKKLLIVEDDADVRLGYSVLLKANHYDTFFGADSTRDPFREARTHQPDLIILDLGLPAGDGFSLLERFRANPNLAEIPVIVVSGRALHPNKERALRAGASAFVQKPWNDKELLAIIGRLLDQPKLSRYQPE